MEVGILQSFQNFRDEMSDAERMGQALALADLYEPLGFDFCLAAEHHFHNYTMSPAPFDFLSWLAGRTSRIRIGPGVIIVPWNDPYRAAAHLIRLDHLTDGRAMLGFGRGLSRRDGPVRHRHERDPRDVRRGRAQDTGSGDDRQLPGRRAILFGAAPLADAAGPAQHRMDQSDAVRRHVPALGDRGGGAGRAVDVLRAGAVGRLSRNRSRPLSRDLPRRAAPRAAAAGECRDDHRP